MANPLLVVLVSLDSGETYDFGGGGFAFFDHAKRSRALMCPFLKLGEANDEDHGLPQGR